jgi:predicted anti-sigma-YlaC factor YlaD
MKTMPLPARALAVVLVLASLSGCSLRTMAVRTVANTLSESGDAFARDEDPDLVRDAVPFALKTYESLLETLPKHEGLLLSSCSGFTQYAYAFVQTDADLLEATDYEGAAQMKARALKLYLRGRGYCTRLLELRSPGVVEKLQIDPPNALAWASRDDVPLLYWTGASWGAAISLGLDRPELVADVPAVKALIERVLALQEDHGRGAAHAIMISLEALPAAMGGSPERARKHFQRAVELSDGLDPGPYVTMASSVALAAQKRDEFVMLLEQAVAIDPDKYPGTRLATLIAQKRARHLLSRVDELFVPDSAAEEDKEEDKKEER